MNPEDLTPAQREVQAAARIREAERIEAERKEIAAKLGRILRGSSTDEES